MHTNQVTSLPWLTTGDVLRIHRAKVMRYGSVRNTTRLAHNGKEMTSVTVVGLKKSGAKFLLGIFIRYRLRNITRSEIISRGLCIMLGSIPLGRIRAKFSRKLSELENEWYELFY